MAEPNVIEFVRLRGRGLRVERLRRRTLARSVLGKRIKSSVTGCLRDYKLYLLSPDRTYRCTEQAESDLPDRVLVAVARRERHIIFWSVFENTCLLRRMEQWLPYVWPDDRYDFRSVPVIPMPA